MSKKSDRKLKGAVREDTVDLPNLKVGSNLLVMGHTAADDTLVEEAEHMSALEVGELIKKCFFNERNHVVIAKNLKHLNEELMKIEDKHYDTVFTLGHGDLEGNFRVAGIKLRMEHDIIISLISKANKNFIIASCFAGKSFNDLYLSNLSKKHKVTIFANSAQVVTYQKFRAGSKGKVTEEIIISAEEDEFDGNNQIDDWGKYEYRFVGYNEFKSWIEEKDPIPGLTKDDSRKKRLFLSNYEK